MTERSSVWRALTQGAWGARSGRQVITHRLFLIFVVFALIPVVVLSVVAIEYVSSNSRDRLQLVLAAQSDTYSDRLLSRLTVAVQRLDVFRGEIQNGELPASEGWRERASYGEEPARMSWFPRDFLPEKLSGAQLHHLRSGHALLIQKPAVAALDEVYLVLGLSAAALEQGFAVIALDDNFFFGAPDTRNLTQENCVYDGQGSLLFATRVAVCQAFPMGGVPYRGMARASVDRVDYTLTYRGLFLNANFLVADWHAGIVTPDADVLQEYTLFRNSFLAFAVLALFALSLLSIRLIRQQMSPLDAIMEGIKRVSDRKYDEPVIVRSGDEFEKMAGAFNTMSQRVSRQLATMGSMSEIDQLILSRGKKEDIARIVLAKTRSVLPGDHFGLLLMQGDDDQQASLYQQKTDNDMEVVVTPETFDAQECKAVEQHGNNPYNASDAALPAFMRSFARVGDQSYQLVPVKLNDRLIAVLAIAFRDSRVLDDEMRELTMSYADRIAVGLSNAEWEAKLFHQANYDFLTDLPNRPALIEELGRRVARAQRAASYFAVIFVDLDNFKLVNDSLGHDFGDQLIVAMGERLATCLRANDIVARLGGDEFVVLCSETSEERLTASSVNEVAIRLQEEIKRSLVIGDREFRLEASMGIALYPNDGEDQATLMRHADTAMYHAKEQGRGCFQFFSQELNHAAEQLMVMSTELKQAIERNEFVLYFQPKVCASTSRIVGAEALIRWQHPTRGLLPPGAFIGAAETLGMMDAIGDWVFEAACAQLGLWRRSGLATVPVAVNVVASQVQSQRIVGQLQELFLRHAIKPVDLELEITENALVSNLKRTVANLEQLRKQGLKISIDDYGTGYSSMAYMKQLPVDKLKIDRCFIIDLATDAADQAIVTSTILLAKSLHIGVVAEGVEAAQQLALLREAGCDEIQGYYFSRPVPADELAQLVAEQPFTKKPWLLPA